MSKYIIEIEEVPYVRRGENALYRAKGFKSLVFDEFGLDKLTPLDKALSSELGEAYQKGFEAGSHEATTIEYQQGLDDAWEAFKKLLSMWLNDDDALFAEDSFLEFTLKVTASEAIAKVTEYEKEKKEHLKRDIQQDIDTLMSSTGMTIEEIADALKQMKGGAE